MSAMFLAMVWHARAGRRRSPKCRASPRCARRCSSGRSASSTTPRTSCGRRSRSRAAISSCCGASSRTRPSSRWRSTSSAGWNGSSSGCCCSRSPSSRGSSFEEIDLEAFLSDLFIRWSEVAPRAWRLDVDLAGRLLADPEALRDALDALLENAVKYTNPGDAVELAAHADGAGGVVIEVSDSGSGRLRPTRCRASSTAGRARTGRAPASAAAPGSASRSSPRSPARTAAAAPCSRCRAGPRSGSICRCGSLPDRSAEPDAGTMRGRWPAPGLEPALS